jgi:hypothetical protein
MPADSGMVFVVILHLSPEHESVLPALLQRHTPMRVVQTEDGTEVEANCVYVIPPGKHLTSVDGHLQLTDLEPEKGKRVAVDLFFRSLADTHGSHAAAIVLSGADGDGTLGIKRIKERGGLTIAQDPDEAEHPSMPQSSIATGMVDWVLQVAEMPDRLLDYTKREARLRVPPEKGQIAGGGDDSPALAVNTRRARIPESRRKRKNSGTCWRTPTYKNARKSPGLAKRLAWAPRPVRARSEASGIQSALGSWRGLIGDYGK